MAKITGNKVQTVTKRMQWHSNMTESNHLGKALLINPAKITGYFDDIFTSQMYSDNSLSTILEKAGAKEGIGQSEWEWKLRGATKRPLICLEYMEPASNTTPGKGTTEFRIKVDHSDWKIGDIVAPLEGAKKYQSRVMTTPQRSGTGFIVTLKLMSDDPQFSLPLRLVQSGQTWGKLFSQYGEGGSQSGSTTYSMPMAMKSRMSRYRKEYAVTGDAANEVLSIAMRGTDGKMHKSWVKYAEAEFWQQWYRELERGLWYSRQTNGIIDESSGRSIYTGPGIQQLLEDSHVHYYNRLSAKLINEFLMDIFYSRVAPGSKRKIKAFTGEYGFQIFHEAMNDLMQRGNWMLAGGNSFNPIEKTSSPMNSNSYSAGYQFVKYKMPNGAELELIHNPLYDDREINGEIDPVTGYPVESMRFTFLDFSEQGIGNNVKMFYHNEGTKLAYVHGLQGPYGPVNGGTAAHNGDYYNMTVQKRCGAHIHDISRCGELILRRQ